MVPSKVGDELRRRRLQLRLKQTDVAAALKTTRAYVSAVERGVSWDPDAEKLVAWAVVLGWPADYLLRKLGRVPLTSNGITPAPAVLTPEIVEAIGRAVASGVAEGVADALAELGFGGDTRPSGGSSDEGRPRPPDA
jgi:transcriptional regulator with XRE-family HTH domain